MFSLFWLYFHSWCVCLHSCVCVFVYSCTVPHERCLCRYSSSKPPLLLLLVYGGRIICSQCGRKVFHIKSSHLALSYSHWHIRRSRKHKHTHAHTSTFELFIRTHAQLQRTILTKYTRFMIVCERCDTRDTNAQSMHNIKWNIRVLWHVCYPFFIFYFIHLDILGTDWIDYTAAYMYMRAHVIWYAFSLNWRRSAAFEAFDNVVHSCCQLNKLLPEKFVCVQLCVSGVIEVFSFNRVVQFVVNITPKWMYAVRSFSYFNQKRSCSSYIVTTVCNSATAALLCIILTLDFEQITIITIPTG